MVNTEQMYEEFLERLNNKTTEELMTEIEQAREDSKDSWILDEMTGNKMKDECFLFRNPCPNRSGACLCSEPDGDSCPLYRWFKAKVLEIEKDIVHVVRCKDCVSKEFCKSYDSITYNDNWFCPDGERREK
jgi:hypothetical protein